MSWFNVIICCILFFKGITEKYDGRYPKYSWVKTDFVHWRNLQTGISPNQLLCKLIQILHLMFMKKVWLSYFLCKRLGVRPLVFVIPKRPRKKVKKFWKVYVQESSQNIIKLSSEGESKQHYLDSVPWNLYIVAYKSVVCLFFSIRRCSILSYCLFL